MIFLGKTHRVGDGITTAAIFDPTLDADDPAVLAAYCLENVDPTLADQVAEGDILVAGTDFGAGDNSERAVLALQALGLAAVIGLSAAPVFVETAEIYGLPVLTAPDATAVDAGHLLRIDLARSVAKNLTTGVQFRFPAVSSRLLAAARRNALLGRMRKVVEDEGFDDS